MPYNDRPLRFKRRPKRSISSRLPWANSETWQVFCDEFPSWKNLQQRLFTNFKWPSSPCGWSTVSIGKTPFIKMIMPQSIKLKLLKNVTRNIVMKFNILYNQKNLQTSTILSIYVSFRDLSKTSISTPIISKRIGGYSDWRMA